MCTGAEIPLITAAIGAGGQIGGSLLKKKNPANFPGGDSSGSDTDMGLRTLAAGGGGTPNLLGNLNNLGNPDMLARLRAFGGM